MSAPLPRRLYRSRDERMISGVSGGLGVYFGIDPALVRVLWVLGTLLSGGLVLIGYLVLWIVVPEEGFTGSASQIMRHNVEQMSTEARRAAEEVREAVRGEQSPEPRSETREEPIAAQESEPVPAKGEIIPPDEAGDVHRGRRTRWAGIILIALGVLFLASNFGLFRWVNWGLYWPLILVAIGALILLNRVRG